MADTEKVKGGALLQLFTELQADKIPLKMQLPNGADIHYAVIIDIHKRNRDHHFLINAPGDYRKLIEETGQSCLRFEFSDKENIKYVLKANTWQFSDERIWVKFPEFIQRYQRRRLFRLEAPHGTRLYFKTNGIRYKLLVVNISLGGTLGVLVSLTKQMEQELKRYNSKIVQDVKLLFPAKDRKKAGSIVNIKRCQIKRQAKNQLTNKFECAMEFQEICEEEHKVLADLFYQWQRDYLRRRKFMSA